MQRRRGRDAPRHVAGVRIGAELYRGMVGVKCIKSHRQCCHTRPSSARRYIQTSNTRNRLENIKT
ncbi:hypothetical protein KGM_213599 [Danaus plexippus plexippus]|uniref:Uncharacterized protein n=1 Tax=Danaus plexippus plexippus TaxID=278856 RepID=A0A212ENT9_DANPL|nr:hypothetical protein KGM_213599 [Danaus plexippus plexippus]